MPENDNPYAPPQTFPTARNRRIGSVILALFLTVFAFIAGLFAFGIACGAALVSWIAMTNLLDLSYNVAGWGMIIALAAGGVCGTACFLWLLEEIYRRFVRNEDLNIEEL